MQCACVVLCCHLWPARLCKIFPHYLLNGAIFGKKLLNTKCVFWFFLQLLSETFFVLRRTEQDVTKNVYWFSCKVPFYSCPILTKLEIPGQFFFSAKYSYIKFHENLSSGSRVVTYRRTDRWDEANSRFFLQFCERAWKYSVLHSAFMASVCRGQQYKLYIPVFEVILQLICTLFTRCILTLHWNKRIGRLLMAFFTRTVWLNR